MVIKASTKEIELLARIMRAEALGEGYLGMLMVGNVVANRVIANCLTFKNIRTITDAIYQPNQFVGVNSSIFNSTPSSNDLAYAKRIINGEYYHPATHALWFYAPKEPGDCKSTWYEQTKSGSYKGHCFYRPDPGTCKEIY